MSISKDYNAILNSLNKNIPFSRYDILTYYINQIKIGETASNNHTMLANYRSYNTYRKDVVGENLNLKLNETYNDEDNMEQSFYDPSLLLCINSSLNSVIYRFPGTVLSPKYPTNNREMTLEDLFSIFYYDYLVALDTKYMLENENNETYYFNKATIDPVTGNETPGGLYRILPVGTTYIDDTANNSYTTELSINSNTGIIQVNTETTESVVEYDGTYTPKIGELLSGELYIVIQSPGMSARKIVFNNDLLPTLFVNDDKYEKTNVYIMNDNQLCRLCDIKLFERLGFTVSWEKLIGILKIYTMLNTITIDDALSAQENEIRNTILNNAKFKLYYYVYYTNSAYPGIGYKCISGINNITYKDLTGTDITIQLGTSFFNDEIYPWSIEDDNEIIVTDDNKQFIDLNNLVNIGRIAPVDGLSNHHIILNIFYTMTLVLNGFSIAEEPEPEPDEPTYTFTWYENNE